ncbi:MAG: sugar ABC transporter substrate-binding protein [Rhizobiaceae bacterium]|nr:sugar ABC transporter substrate-binding protein [Rhizobiaceae bacterium]
MPAAHGWRLAAAAAVVALALAASSPSTAQDGPAGIATPTVLPPFNPDAPACSPPPGLSPALVFLQDNEREFIQGVGRGLADAARDRGLSYEVARADNDSARMVAQAKDALARKVGAVVVAPIDPRAMTRPLQALIWTGTYVGAVVPPPATTILNAPQYETGKVLGDAAAAYIEEELGGTARVVLLTHDSNQFLAPRFVAMRDALARVPGATIVADISPATVNEDGGYATMKTILVAHNTVDVVLGADTVVLGALKALREAGKDRPDQFLGGIDGEPEAVAEIKAGGPYKASVSLASPVFGYAMGQHAADWLAGKSIPQAMDILPRALNAENIAAYEADLADPGAVYADPARRDSYLRMYGNICYDTRDQYLNFPWSSERRG